MITWPAIIKFSGDDELGFIATSAEWKTDADIGQFYYEPMDQLIDSDGVIYSLMDWQDGVVIPKETGEVIQLPRLTDLLRAHASQLGNCCVAKLGFNSISEAISSANTL